MSNIVDFDCDGFLEIESLNNNTDIDLNVSENFTILEFENSDGIIEKCTVNNLSLDGTNLNINTDINIIPYKVDATFKCESDIVTESGQGPAGKSGGILHPVNEKINISNGDTSITCLYNVEFIIHDEIYIHGKTQYDVDNNRPFKRIAGFDDLDKIDNIVNFELVNLSNYVEIYVKICYFTRDY